MARTSVIELRRLILDTTRQLLVEQGYQNLSMRKIANAIGYSATSLYLYFESKDHLVHALIDEGMEHLYQALQESIEEVNEADKQLQKLCETFIRFGLENPEYYEIMFQLHPERMARYPIEKFRRARRNLDIFANTLKNGSQSKMFDLQDEVLAANFIWASLHGTISLIHAKRFDSHIDVETLKTKVILQICKSFITNLST